jgi:hypothetical protein
MSKRVGHDLEVSFVTRQAEKALEFVQIDGELDRALRLFRVEHFALNGAQVWARMRGSGTIDQRSVEVWLNTTFDLARSSDECAQLEVVVMQHGGGRMELGVDFVLVFPMIQAESPDLVSSIKQLAIGARAKALSHYVIEQLTKQR